MEDAPRVCPVRCVRPEISGVCLGERCAWWHAELKCCAVVSIADSLAEMLADGLPVRT